MKGGRCRAPRRTRALILENSDWPRPTFHGAMKHCIPDIAYNTDRAPIRVGVTSFSPFSPSPGRLPALPVHTVQLNIDRPT